MGGGDKQPEIKPIPKAAPTVTREDESVKTAGDNERRRLAAMRGRASTITSRGSILG